MATYLNIRTKEFFQTATKVSDAAYDFEADVTKQLKSITAQRLKKAEAGRLEIVGICLKPDVGGVGFGVVYHSRTDRANR